MQFNFETIMHHVFEYEGGYVDHPSDPGGATNMGITFNTLKSWRKRPITKQDVKNLTKQEAKEIYEANYWNAVRGSELPSGLDLVVMDAGVNSGPRRSVRWLQAALGVDDDGIIGPITLDAARRYQGEDLIRAVLQVRRDFVRSLRTYPVFGRGWENRINSVENRAIQLFSNTR